jgi:DMSO/TMAO reductase YedYZ molybdopterin-dependent catalytic subunit
MNGTINPNGLHVVVSWGAALDIDRDKHRLAIHGLVKRPLIFTLEVLARYPMVTRVTFLECGGNSAPLGKNSAAAGTDGSWTWRSSKWDSNRGPLSVNELLWPEYERDSTSLFLYRTRVKIASCESA